jgi:tRNA A-37 threonylcarbamoyl transferase component Bud32
MELCDLTLRNYLDVAWPPALSSTSVYFIQDLAWPGVRKAYNISSDIAQGVAFIHAMGLVHRDLKPENRFALDRWSMYVVVVIPFAVSITLRSLD